MIAENIEKLVHRIRGTFPSSGIPLNMVIETWQQDVFLLNTPVENARKAMPLVEAFGKFPSLPEFRDMVRRANHVEAEKKPCVTCDSTGWDIGLRMSRTKETPSSREGWWTIDEMPQTQTWKGHEYTYAVPCNCGN